MNNQLKFLVIEDSKKVCEGIAERMQHFPNWKACPFAHHVEEAKNIATKELPQLIFLDWALKGGSAYDVLENITTLPGYNPYIIFNTGYQSENPEIPQEIFNNYKIDKYIVKPIWENLQFHLSQYVNEAAVKFSENRQDEKIVVTDIEKRTMYINAHELVCVCLHHQNSYVKTLYLSDETFIQIKSSWDSIYAILNEHKLDYFITNHKEHLILKDYVEMYRRPFVKLKHFQRKIEIVKDKLAEFEKWIVL